MDRLSPGVFLERRSYRRRRLNDGLRLMPVLGAWVLIMPVFWNNREEAEAGATATTTSSALYFVFGMWFALIVICAALTIFRDRLSKDTEADPDEGPAS